MDVLAEILEIVVEVFGELILSSKATIAKIIFVSIFFISLLVFWLFICLPEFKTITALGVFMISVVTALLFAAWGFSFYKILKSKLKKVWACPNLF